MSVSMEKNTSHARLRVVQGKKKKSVCIHWPQRGEGGGGWKFDSKNSRWCGLPGSEADRQKAPALMSELFPHHLPGADLRSGVHANTLPLGTGQNCLTLT